MISIFSRWSLNGYQYRFLYCQVRGSVNTNLKPHHKHNIRVGWSRIGLENDRHASSQQYLGKNEWLSVRFQNQTITYWNVSENRKMTKRKWKTIIKFRVRCKFRFECNSVPRISDSANATWWKKPTEAADVPELIRIQHYFCIFV